MFFYPLTEEVVKHILVEKILKNFNTNLSQKSIQVELDENAVEFLVREGYSEIYGAREIKRTFDAYISEHLSEMILKEEVKDRQFVKISVENGRLLFKAM